MGIPSDSLKCANYLIYTGGHNYEGVNHDAPRQIKQLINECEGDSRIEEVSARELTAFVHESCRENYSYKVLIFPGGECSAWDKQLSEKTLISLKNLVECNKLALLMICAGSYFAAEVCSFGNMPEKRRALSVFRGKAEGPLHPLHLPLNHRMNARAERISWIADGYEGEGDVYLFAGGHLIPDEQSNCHVLARYTCNKKIAVLSCPVKRGIALLTCVHFEYSGDVLQSCAERPLQNLFTTLTASRSFQKKCFSEMLKRIQKHQRKSLAL